VTARETWAALAPAWQATVEEAWTSWTAGSAGVGCVVTDPSGEIVARGHNRMLEPKTVPHELASTPLAHAEMVTLSTLPFGSYDTHTLYTSFEPCLMCASTIVQLRMGTVAYAAADPLFDGMHTWFADLPFAAARRPERTVLGGPVGTFCHVLHLSWLAFWQPTGPTIDAHARLTPRELEVARAIAEEGHLACVEGTAVDALAAVWDLVV
jgi:tRNA(Arg) A34 adenosine deaminase TadA